MATARGAAGGQAATVHHSRQACTSRRNTLVLLSQSLGTVIRLHHVSFGSAGALPEEVRARHPQVALLADELRIVQHARQTRSVVYLMGRTHARLGKDTPLLQLPRRYLLEFPFKARLLSGSLSALLEPKCMPARPM